MAEDVAMTTNLVTASVADTPTVADGADRPAPTTLVAPALRVIVPVSRREARVNNPQVPAAARRAYARAQRLDPSRLPVLLGLFATIPGVGLPLTLATQSEHVLAGFFGVWIVGVSAMLAQATVRTQRVENRHRLSLAVPVDVAEAYERFTAAAEVVLRSNLPVANVSDLAEAGAVMDHLLAAAADLLMQGDPDHPTLVDVRDEMVRIAAEAQVMAVQARQASPDESAQFALAAARGVSLPPVGPPDA